MDIKRGLFEPRKRNEEILALDYVGTQPAADTVARNLRQNALNLPYRYVRWLESQATSKMLVVKVSRDAGEGQRPGGPGDNVTGQWVAAALKRAAYEGGLERELKAVIAEAVARGTSVLKIGYHKEVIDFTESREAGKDAQSVVPEVLEAAAAADAGEPVDPAAFTAKEGQAHAEIGPGLGNMAADPNVQMAVGRSGVDALLARKASHDDAALKAETQDGTALVSHTRLVRNKVYFRKLRMGEDVGHDPSVHDVADARFWWERQTMTVAEVRASSLFTDSFKEQVRGYDGWNVSGVAHGGRTPATDSMGSDARQAQSEPVLDDDERIVEFFFVYFRQPDMKAGGVRKIVCAECPDEFVEEDDSSPHTGEDGYSMIPGFYPYYDFTPFLETIPRAERTAGIPAIQVGMPQFEQIAEGLRLVHEAALRSVRLHQLHPGLKENAEVMNAINNGRPLAFYAPQALMTMDGKMQEAVLPIQFTGEMPEIERYVAMLQTQWVMVMGMPPSVLQGVGTAETLGQEQIGVAAGERESGSVVEYFEKRLADVFCGLRGLIRGNYDDEDFIAMLGEEGAGVIKAWQEGTADDGDLITVAFGARAAAQQAVDRKQTMEAIQLQNTKTVNVMGQPLPKYDDHHLFEELNRMLGVGAPVLDASTIRQMETTILQLAALVKQVTGVDVMGGGGGQPGGGGGPPGQKSEGGDRRTSTGPNPSEGDGPSSQNIGAGAKRGTVSDEVPAGAGTSTY